MQVQCSIPAPPQFSMKPIADHHDSAFGAADKPSRSISLLTLRLMDRHITASTPIVVQGWEALCTMLASIELNGSSQHVMHSVRSSAQADAQRAKSHSWPTSRARHADMYRHFRLTIFALKTHDAGRNVHV